MSSGKLPGTATTSEEFVKQSKAFDVAYFYFVYKMEFGIRGAELRTVAPGCTGSGPDGVATFDQFVRHIVAERECRRYMPSGDEISRRKLGTLFPDVEWVGGNLWRDTVGFPGPDSGRLCAKFVKRGKGERAEVITLLAIYDALYESLQNCVRYKNVNGEAVCHKKHEDMVQARKALSASFKSLSCAKYGVEGGCTEGPSREIGGSSGSGDTPGPVERNGAIVYTIDSSPQEEDNSLEDLEKLMERIGSSLELTH